MSTVERIIARMAAQKEAVWVFCGDSITHGAFHTQGWRDYTQHFAERVRYEKGLGLHVVVNTAISGHTTREVKAQFAHRVARFRPDFLSLMIGMNDCADTRKMEMEEFRANLREIVARVRAETPAEVILQTGCAIHPERTTARARYPQFMAALREAAAESDAALIDHHADWERARAEARPTFDSWMHDTIHPGALGHWVFAEKMLRDLRIGALEKTPPPAVSRCADAAGKS
jgi:lysophospholipase L1-like esterase